ncbi:MAG: hypothetical protein JKY48_11800 [Flavobacteriales bacterium]|nr:hypothetical protein [Flavobacteriales bacterium]
MKSWRISKYNPIHRDKKGAYIKQEWTSLSDVNETFDSKLFTLNEYRKTEDLYINQIKQALKENNARLLKVVELEKWEPELVLDKNVAPIYDQKDYKIYKSLEDKDIVNIEDALIIARLNLRSDIWCKLVDFDENFEIHFGYDYYMYFTFLDNNNNLEPISKMLFIEIFDSPHW